MSADQVRQFTVSPDDDGIRLDRWFRRNLAEVSFGQVSRWARTGQLRLDGKRAAPGDRIEAGQSIRVPPQGDEAPGEETAEQCRSQRGRDEFVRSLVIHEDQRRSWSTRARPRNQGGTDEGPYRRLLEGSPD